MSAKGQSYDFPLPGLIAETILQVFFWSSFFGHLPAVWFGPMSILRATEYGEEFYYLVAYFSLFLLKIRKFREYLVSYQKLNYFLPLIGLPSLLMGSLRDRTLLVCFATAFGINFYWSMFFMGDEKKRNMVVWSSLLGLFASTSLRFGLSTVIPVWWSPTVTWLCMGLGVICAFVAGRQNSGSLRTNLKESVGWSLTDYRLGVGFGCLVFLTHWFLSAHGIFARWIDLDPFPVGIVMLFCMIIGILINEYPFVRSWGWWSLAVLSGPILISPGIPNYIAIFFAFIVITYITSIWMTAVTDLSSHGRIASLGIAGIVYLFGNLALIWSVAYCFVPPGTGGPFMRERAGQVFCLCLLLVGFSYFSPIEKTRGRMGNEKRNSSLPPKEVLIVLGLIFLVCTVPSIAKRSVNWHNRSGYEGMPTDHVRGMAWAIRFGYDNFGFPNFPDLVTKIKEAKANTIVLVETDTARPFNTNWDVVEYLEEHLHMYSDYGPSTLNETWGCALFSYFPIVRADREVLPSPEGENACLIDATLDVNGVYIDVIGVHFGNTEHVLDRKLQADDVARRALAKSKANRKTVWLGYLTDKTGGPNYNKITRAGLVDASPQQQGRYCIYLFHIGLVPKNFEIIVVGDVTDTDIQIADFYLPKE